MPTAATSASMPVLYSVRTLLLAPATSLIDTMRAIDQSAMQIAVFVDEEERLVGILTDGDIRRAILRGMNLNAPVRPIINYHPLTVRLGARKSHIATLIQDKSRILRLPVLDEERRVLGVYRAEEIADIQQPSSSVVLMAGGLGSRLRPYTDSVPKPMLEVGGKPILEHIISRFVAHGFNNFYLSVNYMAEVIKNYFGDGCHLGAQITYLEENQRMGTAGSLRLLPKNLDRPFFVMNGDLLTATHFSALMEYHIESNARATMCLREYTIEIPYGVVKHEEGRLTGFQEKPKHHHFVNAGIYVLDPSVLAHLPAEGYFDMPSLFDRVMADTPAAASVFPLREYWCDIGRVEDLEQARSDVWKLGEEHLLLRNAHEAA